MIIAASSNGKVGICQAMEVLKSGGSALDAVETGIHFVEDNPEDASVGYGGLPNILGDVELDACIMEGRTLSSGAVGCIRGFRYPISVARQVMEKLPHVFLVGAGAERFAAEIGAERRSMLSPESEKLWKAKLEEMLPPDVITTLPQRTDLAHWVEVLMKPKTVKGTVNFIAMDARGDIACGVSTSGWFNKYPGRLGDSPVIGAGNYADNRYGAAACQGMGEMAIRAATAHSVVLYMKMGLSLQDAGRQAMLDLNDLGGNYLAEMNIVALDKHGTPVGFTSSDEGVTYIYMTAEMANPVEEKRHVVEVRKRWGEGE